MSTPGPDSRKYSCTDSTMKPKIHSTNGWTTSWKGPWTSNYFEEKIQLGNAARLDERNQISGLTRGMPQRYKAILLTAAVRTTSEWLALAQKLEQSFKTERSSMPPVRRFINNSYAGNGRGPGFVAANAITQGTAWNRDSQSPAHVGSGPAIRRPPRDPCQICVRAGKGNLFHWHSDCPRNTRESTSLRNQRNSRETSKAV